jgi:hypothetical protein
MKIYKQEALDALTDRLNKSSIFLQASCSVSNIENLNKSFTKSELDSFIETLNSNADFNSLKDLIGFDQPDLALLVSVLVSTGWNLNDDVFLSEELITAKDTPIHKPIDYQHDPKVILGHIIKSRLVDKTGKELDISGETPANFDIEVAGVLYKSMPVIDNLIKDIMEKANSGQMFVSMECFFNDFSYSFKDARGESRIVARDENTSFLTKYLRVYGGSGEYKGYKVGRVLKNIVFGGQGLVENPANPDSVIRIAASKTVSEKDTKIELKGGVETMEIEEMKKQLDEALAAITSKDAQIEHLLKEMESFKELNKQEAEKAIVAFETKAKEQNQINTDLTTKLTVALETIKTLETEKVTMAKELETVKAKAVEFGKELLEIKKREKATERFAKLSQLKAIEEKDKEATLKELAELSDETFATICKYAGETKTKTETKETAEEVVASLKDVEVVVDVDAQGGTEKIEDELAEVALATAKALLRVQEVKEVKEGGE